MDLGHARAEERALVMAEQCLQGKVASLGALFGHQGDKATKAAQRFLTNQSHSLFGLREALAELTWTHVRARQLRHVIIAFDPTYLGYGSQSFKKHRMELCGNGFGYTWLNSTALAPEGGHVLGVPHQTLVCAKGPDDAEWVDYAPGATSAAARRVLAQNEKQQFSAHCEAIDRDAPPELELDFIADSQFDDTLNIRELTQTSERSHFIIRASKMNRIVQVHPADWLKNDSRRKPSQDHVQHPAQEEGLVELYLEELLPQLPLKYWRELPLDNRGRACVEGRRPAHIAQMSIGGAPVRLARRSGRGKRRGLQEEPVWVNLVRVVETNPPATRDPVEWVLLTDRPIETQEQQEFVARLYEIRWREEEFFRTAKDVFKVEESRLATPEATARLLFFITLKAMFLDALRKDAGLRAGKIPSREERQELKQGAQKLEELEKATVAQRKKTRVTQQAASRMVLGYIAKKGGWKARGATPLGNYVLARGLPAFLEGYRLGHFRWLAQIVKEVGS